jgi:Tol biopolymer transport system component
VYDLKTQKKTPLELPEGHGIVDISPDGKTLLTVIENAFDKPSTRSYLVPLNTLEPHLLTKTTFHGMRFSPDGKWVIGNWVGKKDDKPPYVRLAVVSVADGSERRISLPDEVFWVEHACWSPDGKRIAYHWREEITQTPGVQAPKGVEDNKWFAGRLSVADADGQNAKIILRREYRQDIQGLDWR